MSFKVLPFFAMMITGMFTLYFFQRVKLEFDPKRSRQILDPEMQKTLDQMGFDVKKKKSLQQIYKEFSESDIDNWENVRGPRAEEDNTEYIRAKEKQRLEREKHKEKIKDWHKSVLTKNPKEKEKY